MLVRLYANPLYSKKTSTVECCFKPQYLLMSSQVMASAISAVCSPSSFPTNKASFFTLSSTSVIPIPKTQNFCLFLWISQLGPSHFSPWSGLKHLNISISRQFVRPEGKGKYKGKGVYASLFGVGAPEALVIGVVALLVFGPKGLAEVARNLGKTLRAFQPTIKELQDVSREFKSTLEREIGLDDIRNASQSPLSSNNIKTPNTDSVASADKSGMTDPNGSAPLEKAYSSEELLKITEEQLKESAAQQYNPIATPSGSQANSKTQSQVSDTVHEGAVVMPPTRQPGSET